MKIEEYYPLASAIINKNDLQRKKVNVRGKPYVLLRKDLLNGCIMPPIILAITEEYNSKIKLIVSNILGNNEIKSVDEKLLEQHVSSAISDGQLLILDGLQRTYTIQECHNEAVERGILDYFKSQTVRTEIYLGLSKVGILYRMLTLNTGQTPMSFRHQIEMLYHDYLKSETSLPDGIEILREADERRARGASKYKYSDVVDMFYAFSTGNPSSLDKQALVDQLSELDFLEGFTPDTGDMTELLLCYNTFVRKIEAESGDWTALVDGATPNMQVERPFGQNVASIFERVQPMTAFGAECKRLLKMKDIESISVLKSRISEMVFKFEIASESLAQLLIILDRISKRATKIGPAQREFFQYSFRELLNSNSDNYLDLSNCWLAGEKRYMDMNY